MARSATLRERSGRSSKAGRRSAAAAAFVLVALALAGCTSSDGVAGNDVPDGQGYVSPSDVQYLELHPDQRKDPVSFSGPTADGSTFDSASLKGKVTVVNFWYAGCPPCRLEAPILASLSKSLTGVQFVGVNTSDDADVARTFDTKNGLAYPSLLAAQSSDVLLAFAGYVPPSAVPTTLILDAQGRVASRIMGLIEKPEILAEMVQKVEAEG